MTRGTLPWVAAAWMGVWLFWFAATRTFHPTLTLAIIVTTSLVFAYATAAAVNHLLLFPRYWRTGRYGAYAARLAATMTVLTAAALAVIRASYAWLWGPDPDPNGMVKHFAIDLFGMTVHLVGAAAVVQVFSWCNRVAPARRRIDY